LEPIHAANTVPQGYAVDEFKGGGIMLEGSSVPLDVTALSLTGFGPSYVSSSKSSTGRCSLAS
jgi:hypothetical protein